MNLFMILKVALRAIARNKTRSLLTTLGIIVGIAVVAIGQGATTMMMKEISGIGNNLIMIFPGSRNQGGVHAGSGASQTLTAEDGEMIAHDLSHLVRAVSPMVRTGSQVIYQENNWSTQIQGVSVEFPEVRSWEIVNGAFFPAADQRGGSRVCVLGQTVADNLFPGGGDPVGKSIRIRNMPFRVLGVMVRKGSNSMGHDQDDVVIMPYTTVKRVLQNSVFNNVNMLLVSLYSLGDIPAAKTEITALPRQRQHAALKPEPLDRVRRALPRDLEPAPQHPPLRKNLEAVVHLPIAHPHPAADRVRRDPFHAAPLDLRAVSRHPRLIFGVISFEAT